MPTQQEIADHLFLNQSEVSRHMKTLGIDWKAEGLDEIRHSYIKHLRMVAAGHSSDDGEDLTKERILTERVDREIKQLDLAVKKSQLVDIAKLEPMLAQMIGAFRSELLSMPDKIKDEILALHGVEVDSDLFLAPIYAALSHFARYHPSDNHAYNSVVRTTRAS